MTPQDPEPVIPEGYLDLLESEPRPPYSPLHGGPKTTLTATWRSAGWSTAWSKIRTWAEPCLAGKSEG